MRRHRRQGEGSWGLQVNITTNSERDKLKSMEGEKNCCVHAYAKKRSSCRNQRQVGNIFNFSLNCFHGQDLSLGPILPIFQMTTLRLERWSKLPKRPTGLVCGSPRTRPRAGAQDPPGWTETTGGLHPPSPRCASALAGRPLLLPRGWPALDSPGCNALGATLRGSYHSPTSCRPRQKLIKQPPVTSTLINKNLFSASLSSSPRGPPPVTTLSITPHV